MGSFVLKPDIRAHHIHASITWTLRSQVNTANSLLLHAEDLEVIRIQDQDGFDIRWTYDGHQISIFWNDNVPKDQERKLTISYQVQSPIEALYFGGPTPELPERGYWMATDHETTRARHWLPCIDHSNVRTTFDIIFSTTRITSRFQPATKTTKKR